MTLNLNWPQPNICYRHHLIMLNISVLYFFHPLGGLRGTKQETQYVRICLNLNYDLDHKQTWGRHVLCTSAHHPGYMCQFILKIISVDSEREIKASQTDSNVKKLKARASLYIGRDINSFFVCWNCVFSCRANKPKVFFSKRFKCKFGKHC